MGQVLSIFNKWSTSASNLFPCRHFPFINHSKDRFFLILKPGILQIWMVL